MTSYKRTFGTQFHAGSGFGFSDLIILMLIATLVYLGTQLATGTPEVIQGPA